MLWDVRAVLISFFVIPQYPFNAYIEKMFREIANIQFSKTSIKLKKKEIINWNEIKNVEFLFKFQISFW